MTSSTLQKREQAINAQTDFKQHFLREDNLTSLQSELIFSVLRRYNCLAGCHVCYVDKYFEEHHKKDTGRLIPQEITPEMTALWDKVFDHYYFRNTIDDLYWMKQKHPHLFNWYKDNSSKLYFGSMTDNNFIRAWDILINEIDTPAGVYELTFSDEWLKKIRVDEIVEKLDKIHKKVPITQVKIIQSDFESLNWPVVKKVTDWMSANGVMLAVHHNSKKFDTVDLGHEYQQMTFASYDGDLYTVCGEADYLQYDSFFLTLIDAIDPNCEPYDTIADGDFNLHRHVGNHMHGKIKLYNQYANKLAFAPGELTKVYRNYFKWVSENVIVHSDYNFISEISLRPEHTFYQKYIENGWTGIKNVGIVKPSDTIIPLFEIKK